jgi:hypothetical protein
VHVKDAESREGYYSSDRIRDVITVDTLSLRVFELKVTYFYYYYILSGLSGASHYTASNGVVFVN